MSFESLARESPDSVGVEVARRRVPTARMSHDKGGTPLPAPLASMPSLHHQQSFSRRTWSRLSRMSYRRHKEPNPAPAPSHVNLNDELASAALPVHLLAQHFSQHSAQHKQCHILLHHLRLGIDAAIDPKAPNVNHSTTFRITCAYADNGPMRWTVWKTYRDFERLHLRFKAMQIGSPLHTPKLPSLKAMFHDSGNEAAQTFAKALETYLLELMRLYCFKSHGCNRIAAFLEISDVALRLAAEDGAEKIGKSGSLACASRKTFSRASNQASLLHPRRYRSARSPKWWIVRDDYLIASGGVASKEIYDVFLLDSSLVIERPERLRRQITAWFRNKTVYKLDPRKLIHEATHEKAPTRAILRGANLTLDPTSIPAAETTVQTAQHPSQRSLALDSEALGDNASTILGESSLDKGGVSEHVFYVHNAERRLKLVAKSKRELEQFISSIAKRGLESPWCSVNRHESYAPVRRDCSAVALIDAEDYLREVSIAIEKAQKVVYIHDWWLSPELQLQRGKSEYRLDQLLLRKAEQGVIIHVIIYREVAEQFTPVASEYAKMALRGLHKNILVQRSPSHFQTGVFFFAHHEKLVVVDNQVAFMGGIDLCFGRYDAPDHTLTDENAQGLGYRWPGKDYANPRVLDFHDLEKPFEDMYDRSNTARMPWHDTGLMVVGQPARDLARHFTQRWNMLIRTKRVRVEIPFLNPPCDYKVSEVYNRGAQGSLEVQICRSCGVWSIGYVRLNELSVHNAYIQAIESSQHFVYIENQFFITSTEIEGVRIENAVGDALVNRIIKAHAGQEKWRCVILIPLLPGFPGDFDESEGSSVRMIVHCQNRSISRGLCSIFGRLKTADIAAEQYITFFSLRQWGEFKSGQLCTEQLYIHSKTMTVDDRLTIIGSANINERSMQGNRDSELACVIRDTDLITSSMGGKAYAVGRWNQDFRMRLMAEHLGIEVQASEKILSQSPVPLVRSLSTTSSLSVNSIMSDRPHRSQRQIIQRSTASSRFKRQLSHGLQKAESMAHGMSSSNLPAQTLGSSEVRLRQQKPSLTFETEKSPRVREEESFIDYSASEIVEPLMTVPDVTWNDLIDPVEDNFQKSLNNIAQWNTEAFRDVFKCAPDSQISCWADYKESLTYAKCFQAPIKRRDDEPGLGFTTAEIDQMKSRLQTIKGHIVMFPHRFLEQEDITNNFLSTFDKLKPLPIFD